MPPYGFEEEEEEAYFRYHQDDAEGHYRYDNYRNRAFSVYGPINILVHVMMAALVFLVIAGVLCGVALLAESAEEFPSTARRVMWALIAINGAVHVSVMLVDQPSWWCSLWSLATNVVFARLMVRFPFVPSLTHPLVLAATAMCAAETLMWVFALRQYISSGGLTLAETMSFLGFLWLVPIGFLCSAVPDKERLPGARDGGAGSWPTARPASAPFVQPNRAGFDTAGPAPRSAGPGPLRPARNQSVVGRLVYFFKHPDDL